MDLKARIDAEMAEYSDGAYADHGSARDQLERFAADVIAMANAQCAEWCAKVQAHHSAKDENADEVEQAFVDGEACGAEDCVEAINSHGAWPY